MGRHRPLHGLRFDFGRSEDAGSQGNRYRTGRALLRTGRPPLLAGSARAGRMSFVRPSFQAQNPAINGYYLGWASCTCYAGAMAASYDRQVKQITTGEAVRRRTGDTVK